MNKLNKNKISPKSIELATTNQIILAGNNSLGRARAARRAAQQIRHRLGGPGLPPLPGPIYILIILWSTIINN